MDSPHGQKLVTATPHGRLISDHFLLPSIECNALLIFVSAVEITNKKLHVAFQMTQKSLTLEDLKDQYALL